MTRSNSAVLLDRRFGLFLSGKLASTMAIWITNVTAALYVYGATESATKVGFVSVLQFLPQLVLAPYAGSLADRIDRRYVLMAARTSSVVTAAALAVWLATAESGAVWPVYLASLALGVGLALASPSINALVPSLVPEDDLVPAITLNTASVNVARAIGPALGAYLYTRLGPAAGYGLSAAGHLVFVTVLWYVRPRTAGWASTDGSIRGAIRYVRERRSLGLLLISIAAIGFVVDVVITLSPPIADALGQGEEFVGILGSAFGVGAIAVLIISSRLDRKLGLRGTGIVGFGCLAAGMILLATGVSVVTAILGMAVAGMGFLLATSGATSRIQLSVSEGYRGRVMALWAIGFLGTRPLAASVHGLVADKVSVSAAVMVSATVAMVGGVCAHLAHEDTR
jgi:MFS family permease